MKTKLFFALKFVLLVIIYFVLFAVISATMLPKLPESSSANDASGVLPALLAMCMLNTAVLFYLTSRAQWAGLKLIGAITFVLFGVTTFMSQIETAVFVRTLPEGFLVRLILAGFLFSALFSALLVLIVGKKRQVEPTRFPSVPPQRWILKLTLISLFYIFIYFTFGYFIAWRNPAVREYYGGEDPGNYFAQLYRILQTTPWLFAFQFLRGLLWTALALPVIRMLRGGWREAALVVALLFSVVMNTQLLLPNPLMPYEVRMTHLLETASSNFIFGFVLVWFLRNEHAKQTT